MLKETHLGFYVYTDITHYNDISFEIFDKENLLFNVTRAWWTLSWMWLIDYEQKLLFCSLFFQILLFLEHCIVYLLRWITQVCNKFCTPKFVRGNEYNGYVPKRSIHLCQHISSIDNVVLF